MYADNNPETIQATDNIKNFATESHGNTRKIKSRNQVRTKQISKIKVENSYQPPIHADKVPKLFKPQIHTDKESIVIPVQTGIHAWQFFEHQFSGLPLSRE